MMSKIFYRTCLTCYSGNMPFLSIVSFNLFNIYFICRFFFDVILVIFSSFLLTGKALVLLNYESSSFKNNLKKSYSHLIISLFFITRSSKKLYKGS